MLISDGLFREFSCHQHVTTVSFQGFIIWPNLRRLSWGQKKVTSLTQGDTFAKFLIACPKHADTIASQWNWCKDIFNMVENIFSFVLGNVWITVAETLGGKRGKR